MSTPSPHPDAARLARYGSRHLPAPEALAVSDHLAGCSACRAMLPAAAGAETSAERKIDLPLILPDTPPNFEEMAALLDGTLDDAQDGDVRARLAAAPEATAAFADLQRFHDEMAALPPKWHGPVGASEDAAVPAGEAPPAPGEVVPFSRPRWLAWGAVAAAAMVLLSVGWWRAGGTHGPRTPPLWADADLSRLPDVLRRGVERAAQTGTVEPPSILAELSLPPGVLAGAAPKPDALRQIAPVGVVVREDHPVLRWTAREGATAYVVYLVDSGGNAPLLRQEVPGGTTEWTPPAPLARGATFEWQVEARRGSEILARAPRPPAPEARFQVLDAPQDAELSDAERLYPRNELVLGTAYAQAGLEEAAARQFEKLARRYPKSGVAERLRREAHDRMPAAR